jgi:threonine aldolase
MNNLLDLSSDTATQPTREMRAFMAAAPVGDDQRGEDPTVNALQDEGARLLGKAAALFLPSATMANQIALRVHTQPGDEIVCHEHAHIRLYEGGGPAVLSGCLLCPLPGPRGTFTPAALEAVIRPNDPHFARTRWFASKTRITRPAAVCGAKKKFAPSSKRRAATTSFCTWTARAF